MLRYYLSILLFVPCSVFAVEVGGFGDIADNLLTPVSIATDFVTTASIATGIGFLLGSFLKYLQYRTNPMAAPISSVIWLVVIGTLLLCLPLAYKLAYDQPPTTIVETK